MSFLPNLISSEQLSPAIVAEFLAAAKEMHAICDAKHRTNLLADKIVALIFLEPSSRTMLSFQAAAQRLHAGVISMHGKDNSSFSKGESLTDTMKLISGYADLVVLRSAETGSATTAAAACSVPFINAGDGANEHPTQALTDAYTIWHELGTLEGLHIALGFDPKHSRTIHSLVKLLSRYKGNHFTFVSPDPLKAPADLLELLKARGCSYTENNRYDRDGQGGRVVSKSPAGGTFYRFGDFRQVSPYLFVETRHANRRQSPGFRPPAPRRRDRCRGRCLAAGRLFPPGP